MIVGLITRLPRPRSTCEGPGHAQPIDAIVAGSGTGNATARFVSGPRPTPPHPETNIDTISPVRTGAARLWKLLVGSPDPNTGGSA